jgi:hypothetical protein
MVPEGICAAGRAVTVPGAMVPEVMGMADRAVMVPEVIGMAGRVFTADRAVMEEWVFEEWVFTAIVITGLALISQDRLCRIIEKDITEAAVWAA